MSKHVGGARTSEGVRAERMEARGPAIAQDYLLGAVVTQRRAARGDPKSGGIRTITEQIVPHSHVRLQPSHSGLAQRNHPLFSAFTVEAQRTTPHLHVRNQDADHFHEARTG